MIRLARLGLISASAIFLGCFSAGAQLKVEAEQESVFAVPRQFGSAPLDTLSLSHKINSEENGTAQSVGFGSDVSKGLQSISSQFAPKVLYEGLPLIQTKGMVKGRGVLFISDTGKDGTNNEPAKIWKFDPTTQKLEKFYEGPLLVNSKWLFYVRGSDGSSDELVIADYGEEPAPRAPGNGQGAKVFAIEVQSDGTPGKTRIIHEGPPFRSPEGVTVIGRTVILSDWAAGEETTRPEAPDAPFLSGALFALPLDGSKPPERLFPDHKWITLIGACIYMEGKDLYLRLIDIDGDRHDKSDLAALPQSGQAAFYRVKVESRDPLKLGELQKVRFREDTPLSLKLENFGDSSGVFIDVLGEGEFENGQKTMVVSKSDVNPDGRISFIVNSPSDLGEISLQIREILSSGDMAQKISLILRKHRNSYSPVEDNKHAGARVTDRFGPMLGASADGTSKTLMMFPVRGGNRAVLWRGAPLRSPMGVQFSFDESKIWLTDQNAGPNRTSAIFEFDVPSLKERIEMFPNAPMWGQ